MKNFKRGMSILLGTTLAIGTTSSIQAQPLNPSVSYASQVAQQQEAEIAKKKSAGKVEAVKGKELKDLSPAERKKAIDAVTAMLGKMNVLSKEFPNPSLASPNANGVAGTILFASVGYVNHWDGTTNQDGNMGLGISLGDPREYLGTVISVNNDSLGFNSDSFGQNGGFGVRFNRYVADYTALAVGSSNITGWGVFAPYAKSYYAALTQGIPLSIFPITLNVGAGSGSFYSSADAQNGVDSQFRPFAGIGILLYKGLSLSADWAVQEYNVGLTYSWKLGIPMFASAGAMNLNEHNSNKPHLQLGYGIAYPFNA